MDLDVSAEGEVHHRCPIFCFEVVWLQSEEVSDVVAQSWGFGSGNSAGSVFCNKVVQCGTRLTEWNRLSFKNVTRQIRDLNSGLCKLKKGTVTESSKAKSMLLQVK
ncbi:UNVERIFIED_CONTAM: hypothetical protein Slati_3734400 [Sesamum latifolium]|uniref:Uncharacterized protein n=1 Tax=Sesamum latifolium TaxID=2727402 RepID=A0AAW2U3M6_9LAMI